MPTVFNINATQFFDAQMRRFDLFGKKSKTENVSAEPFVEKRKESIRKKTKDEQKREQYTKLFQSIGSNESVLPVKSATFSSPKTKRTETDDDVLTAGLTGEK